MKDRADIRSDVHDLRSDRQDLHADRHDFRSDRTDLHADRNDLRSDRQDLRLAHNGRDSRATDRRMTGDKLQTATAMNRGNEGRDLHGGGGDPQRQPAAADGGQAGQHRRGERQEAGERGRGQEAVVPLGLVVMTDCPARSLSGSVRAQA